VHISLIAFDGGAEGESTPMLDGQRVAGINANLTSASDLSTARILPENGGISFIGSSMHGPFEIEAEQAIAMLKAPINLNGKPNSDVVRPVLNAQDITQRPDPRWVLYFVPQEDEAEAAFYEFPFEYVRRVVKPVRDKNHRKSYRLRWWLHGEARPALVQATAGKNRVLVTPRVSKHRIFRWIDSACLPSDAVVTFARDDDYFFGVLHSRVHEVWALALGTRLEDRPRYTPTSCFETFPFPAPDDAARERISQAAQELDALRCRWLCPPEWMRAEVLEFPARADGIWRRFVAADSVDAHGIGTAEYSRPVPRDLEMTVYDARPDATGVLQTRAVKLKDALPRRTLTNLYNERPAWLENAHRVLDEAVFAAYGWDETDLSDEKILARLLKLNLQRAA
jgi:hypothetical protein